MASVYRSCSLQDIDLYYHVLSNAQTLCWRHKMTCNLFSLGEQDTKLRVINYTVHRNADYHYSPSRQSFRNDTRVDEHTRAILLAPSTFSGSSFTSDINVSIKGRWEKLEQGKEIIWMEQEEMLPIGPGAVKQEMTFPVSWVWRGESSVGRVADRKKGPL
jgi:hypothetical protein